MQSILHIYAYNISEVNHSSSVIVSLHCQLVYNITITLQHRVQLNLLLHLLNIFQGAVLHERSVHATVSHAVNPALGNDVDTSRLQFSLQTTNNGFKQ